MLHHIIFLAVILKLFVHILDSIETENLILVPLLDTNMLVGKIIRFLVRYKLSLIEGSFRSVFFFLNHVEILVGLEFRGDARLFLFFLLFFR